MNFTCSIGSGSRLHCWRKKATRNEDCNTTTLFSRVYADLANCAAAVGEDDCTWLYNLALQLPGVWGDFLVRFHFQYVNPSALKVKPSIFGLVARLDEKLTLVKIALMLFCYMGKDDSFEVVGQIIYANGIMEPKMEKIRSQLDYLRAAEAPPETLL